MIRPIILAPDRRLRMKCPRITTITAFVRRLASDMIVTMQAAGGIGLAAPQVGVLKRVIVVTVDDAPVVMVNPEIGGGSDDLTIEYEGCLSLPAVVVPVMRPRQIWARWQALDGEETEALIGGQTARIVQHEIDHLGGVLITDRNAFPMP